MVTTGKANPIRWLWNGAKRVFSRLRGGNVEKEVAPGPEVRDAFLSKPEWSAFSEKSAADVASGAASVQRWQLNFREQLRRAYVNEYVAARGGLGAMTQADWGRLGGMLKEQYTWMNRFAEQMARGELTEGQVRVRMQMYFDSAREAHSRAHAASWRIELPAHPGDGSTICKTNCKCAWDLRETEMGVDAYWTLGVAEHCPDCMDRAGKWNPYHAPKVPT